MESSLSKLMVGVVIFSMGIANLTSTHGCHVKRSNDQKIEKQSQSSGLGSQDYFEAMGVVITLHEFAHFMKGLGVGLTALVTKNVVKGHVHGHGHGHGRAWLGIDLGILAFAAYTLGKLHCQKCCHHCDEECDEEPVGCDSLH